MLDPLDLREDIERRSTVVRRIAILLLTLAFAAAGMAVRSAPANAAGPIYAPPGKYYLAVGDSLGWGYQGALV
jgi:hypothetical protein